ncbi:hypothetical protein [Streptomyces sp. NBC_00385]|uniref:hypothetical protein n=1 Tax=Streptomyces sp. NBC_00385 TaxID=2975733 RepID=UPI002DD99598|nr:hypothetical protein [Streptomyces sp. NBC_00385]WRZ04197.1 hypothetical protein OG959_12945 [Streptomyces sp. NBC_00385]
MSIRRTAKSRRVAAAASMVAALALVVTGCGGDDGGKGSDDAGASSSAKPSEGDKGAQEDTAAGDKVDPNVKLAEVKGQGGVTLVVNQVQRDSGGFITVQGEIKNDSDQARNSGGWAGSEMQIINKNPNSIAGAALIDKAGKKRYYILRDTEGRCLCTTGIVPIQPGKSTPVFMQFPAPPSSTSEVDFFLPTFATTTLKISG